MTGHSDTDHLTAVRAALAWPRSSITDWPDAAGALLNAAPAIAALADECERLRATVSVLDLKVVDAEQSHMAAIATERRRREAVEIERDGAALDRRRHFALYTREHEINATLTTRIATLEAELVQARAAHEATMTALQASLKQAQQRSAADRCGDRRPDLGEATAEAGEGCETACGGIGDCVGHGVPLYPVSCCGSAASHH